MISLSLGDTFRTVSQATLAQNIIGIGWMLHKSSVRRCRTKHPCGIGGEVCGRCQACLAETCANIGDVDHTGFPVNYLNDAFSERK